MANPEKGLTRLHSLDAHEISLVPKGANRRKFLIFKAHEDDEDVEKAALTAEDRKHIAPSNFALPKTKQYPIHDISHARNALARSSGKPEEAKVKAAVYAKYPSLKPSVGKGAKMPAAQSLHDMISKTDPNVMQKVEDCIKSHFAPEGEDKVGKASAPVGDDEAGTGGALTDQAKAAVKAVVRILNPFKEHISPLLMHEIIDAAGFELTSEGENESGATHIGDGKQSGEEGEEYAAKAAPKHTEDDEMDEDEAEEMDEEKEMAEKDFKATPAKVEGVDEMHFGEAKQVAEKAYKEHMEKLGYRKYPDAEMTMKTKDGAPVATKKGANVSKSADSALSLSTVDASTRQKVEKAFKAQGDKIADLETQLKARDARDRHKEIVAKAASLGHVGLPQDELVATLEDADKLGKESYERIVKNFETLNEQGRSSNLFREVGSNLPAGGNDSANAWSRIEKAAEGWVQKSGEKLSRAEAIDAFLKTSEGARMYGEYKAGRKDGI